MAIKLRDYQKKQYDFIDGRIDIADTVAIESPTGSGKTIVMLEYAKEWLNRPENHMSNVIISTGFNNLVYLLEERAKEMGLKTKVLIGTRAVNCPKLMREAGVEYKVFTEDTSYRCGTMHNHLDTESKPGNKKCPMSQKKYKEHYDSIGSEFGNIIITNHSSLLIHQHHFGAASLLIIDEAHTFTNFYDSFVQLNLDKNDLIEMDEAISNIRQPMQSIIKMNMKNMANLPPKQIDSICEKIESNNLKRRVREFFETKKADNNYIEFGENGYVLDRFYKEFEFNMMAKKVLFSATMDKYTLDLFNVRESNFYKEYKTFCDYSKSEFIAIPDKEFKTSLLKFLDYVDSKGLESGLILSTTISDMKIALRQNGYNDYVMFSSLTEFEKYKGKKILVGSRSLFQGIDIQGIQFVGLNVIPFPNWSDKNKALQNYLTNNGQNSFDPWKDFTIPKTENDIIQSTGRLWRNIESKGVVSIFDDRIEKFKYIVRHTMDRYRHGIEINIMRDDKVEKFEVK